MDLAIKVGVSSFNRCARSNKKRMLTLVFRRFFIVKIYLMFSCMLLDNTFLLLQVIRVYLICLSLYMISISHVTVFSDQVDVIFWFELLNFDSFFSGLGWPAVFNNFKRFCIKKMYFNINECSFFTKRIKLICKRYNCTLFSIIILNYWLICFQFEFEYFWFQWIFGWNL